MIAEDFVDFCRKYGHSSLSYSTLDSRFNHYTSPTCDGYIAYKKVGKTIIALNDPVCSESTSEELISAFKKYCVDNTYKLMFFAATNRFDKEFLAQNFDKVTVAKEAVLDATNFTLSGNKMENVRRGYNHARNVNLRMHELKVEDLTSGDSSETLKIYRQFLAISKKWLKSKTIPELEFITGKLDEKPNNDLRYFYASSEKRVEGFIVYNQIYPTGDWYLDMTRRKSDSPNGVMEYLIVESLKILKQEGMKKMYLGMVPNLEIDQEILQDKKVAKAFIKLFINRFNSFYPANSEYFFKNKFGPKWENLYLYSTSKISIGLIYDLFLAFQPTGLKGVLKHKIEDKLQKLSKINDFVKY